LFSSDVCNVVTSLNV